MNKIRYSCLFPFLAVLFLAASPAFANGLRADVGASGKGVPNPDCAATILDNPACFEFTPASATQATWEAFSLLDFGTATFTTTGPYDLFVVNGITAGTEVTLSLTGTNVAFGSFLCGDSFTASQLPGFCSDPDSLIADPASIFSQIPDGSGDQQTYVFNASAPGTWVFYATAGEATISVSNSGGGSTAVPEPSSLLLLSAGLVLAGLKLRRS